MHACIRGAKYLLRLSYGLRLLCRLKFLSAAKVFHTLLSACSHVSNMIFYSPNKVRQNWFAAFRMPINLELQ
jgi:hypothetical protein